MKALAQRFRYPPGVTTVIALRSALHGVGTGLYLAGSAVFFTRYVGLSPTQVGIGLSIAWTIGLLVKIPFGMLADRLGGGPIWLVGILLQAVMFLVYPVVDGFALFLIVASLEAIGVSMGSAGFARYLGGLFPAGSRAGGSAYLRSAVNAGMALGTVLAGFSLAADTRLGYQILVWGIAGLLLVDGALIAWGMPRFPRPQPRTGQRDANDRAALRDLKFVSLAALNSIFVINGPLLSVVFPLWLIQRTDAPPAMISVFLLINMVLAILFQVAAAKRTEELAGAAQTQRLAGMALAVACVALAISDISHGLVTVGLLLLALLAITAGELFVAASAWGISFQLAPEQRRGEYLALYSMGGQIGWAAGPAGLSALAIGAAPWGWPVIAVLFVTAGLVTPGLVTWASRGRNTNVIEAATPVKA